MSRIVRSSVVAVLLILVVAGGRARAQNEGQEDLDRATEVKLSAKSVNDLGEVVRLLESALKKGLDQGNTKFANSLLASTLIQRGSAVTRMLLLTSPDSAKFAEYRKTALADLEKGVQLNPEQPQALYFIARLNLIAGGDAKRAGEALRQAIDLSTEQPPLRAKALMLRASVEKDPQKKMADLDEAVRIVPDDDAVRRVRGLLRANMGKLEESLADLDKAIELAPKQLPNYEAKAMVLVRMKKYDEALISLDKAHELSPGSIRPLLQKAQIHGLQSNLDAALHELNRALAMNPNSADVLLLRAGVHRENDDLEKALADADQALKLKPKLAAAMRLRAVILTDAGKPGEAIAQLEKLRQSDPKDLLGMLQLGMLYISQDKHGQAVDAYAAVLAQIPQERLALRGRGDALLNLGKHRKAIADYETLIKLVPKDPGTLNNLAWVLATSPREKLRDGKRALELATKACELTNYRAGHILSTLAAAHAELGDFQAAVKWVEKGLEVAKESEKDPLGKELESYRAGKPWRELLWEGKPQETPDQGPGDQQQEKKPQQ